MNFLSNNKMFLNLHYKTTSIPVGFNHVVIRVCFKRNLSKVLTQLTYSFCTASTHRKGLQK